MVMLFQHDVRRVDYPIRPPPLTAARLEQFPEEKKSDPLQQKGSDGIRIHMARILPWEQPQYGWYDRVIRAVIEAINVSTAPASRAHDFYLYENFIIHDNFEIGNLIRWKPTFKKGAWQELNALDELS